MINAGVVVRVVGVVVDALFPSGDLPSINTALMIKRDDGSDLVVEVQEHMNTHIVRAIAMGATAGIRRGLEVIDTKTPITVPVGPLTMGRMFNVLGEPIDGRHPSNRRLKGPFTTVLPHYVISVSSLHHSLLVLKLSIY